MKQHIVLFGAGTYAKKILKHVEKYFVIDAVCDNNVLLQGNLFCDRYDIISVVELERRYKDICVLIALDNRKTYDAVSEQLRGRRVEHKHVNLGIFEACIRHNDNFYIDEENVALIQEINSGDKNIYVFTAPSHSNLGDQAQSYCIEVLLEEKYPDYNIYIYDEAKILRNYYELLFIIKDNLRDEDRIVLHSGYRLTNLYMDSEYIVEMMSELFENRKMIFLPQTVHYTDKLVEKRVSKCIKENVAIMCRDTISYDNASRIFPTSRVLLYPDVVTSLIGRYRFKHKREGVLFVMRSNEDGESLLTNQDLEIIKNLVSLLSDVTVTDTTINVNWKKIAQNRKYYIEKEIEYYSKYQIIVTNRFHGCVLALAANTPVIVLPTKDHKITAGLKWFMEAGYQSVRFCGDLMKLYDMARDMLGKEETYNNSDYFYQNYYKDFSLENLL